MSPDYNLLLLRNHKLFRQLTTKECRELNIDKGFIQARKNEFIYLNNFTSNRLFFLKKGYVKIGTYDEEGKEIIREILHEGDIFGQVNLEQESNSNEFAQAIKKDATICSFTIEDFEKILEKRPDLAISYTKLVGLRLKTLQTRISNIMYKDVKERLRDFFIYLVGKNNIQSDEVLIENYLTHADIAGLIGSTRQTVTTLINELEEKGLLQFSRKEIRIKSMDKLKKIRL